jgi:hypothetical protein
MTAAAGTVVSCTVFLPECRPSIASSSDTDRPAPHARRVSFLHVDCCVACLHRSNIRFLLLCIPYARVLVSSMQKCNTTGTADIASTVLIALLPACSISLCRLIVLDCLCQCRSQISPVGSSIDRTVQCQAPYSCFPGHPAQCSA